VKRFEVHPLCYVTFVMAWVTGALTEYSLTVASLALHELCHAGMARLCGFRIHGLSLLPVGMQARIEGLFETRPHSEVMIAMAGPLSNLLLAGTLLVSGIHAPRAVAINLMLAAINLLPGLPLDGGRILRAVLAQRIGILWGTRIAAASGMLLGILLIGLGIGYRAFNVGVFGLFLGISAHPEWMRADWIVHQERTGKASQIRQSRGMPIRHLAVAGEMTAQQVMRRFRPLHYHWLAVIGADGQDLGTLTESMIVQALNRGKGCLPLSELLTEKQESGMVN